MIAMSRYTARLSLMSGVLGLAALGVLSGCKGGSNTVAIATPSPSTSASPIPFPGATPFTATITSQAVTMSGSTAVIPMPSSAPYATTISLSQANVTPNTNFATTIASTAPSGIPPLSILRHTQAVGSFATLLEYVQMTPNQDITGTGGFTINASVPNAYVQNSTHFWAQVCLTPLDGSPCPAWVGPFGPATTTPGTTTSSLAVTIPLNALAGTFSHSIAIYSIADSGTPAQASAPNTYWTTQGRQILLSTTKGVAGTPFFVKGVAYSQPYNGFPPVASPLGQMQTTTWTSDLAQWRAMGANAVHVYNAAPSATSDLTPFLTAAYSGSAPVYAMLESYFGPPGYLAYDGPQYAAVPCPNYPGNSCYSTANINRLIAAYQSLAQRWGPNPDVMGFDLGTEYNGGGAASISPDMWAQLNQIAVATRRMLTSIGAQKILTTAVVDDGSGSGTIPTIAAGEAAGFAIDAWGSDIYRGPNFSGCSPPQSAGAVTCLWTEVKAVTTKPFLLMEYGAPVSYHPSASAAQPNAVALPTPFPSATPYPCGSLPMNDTPDMRDVVTYYSCVQTGIEAQSAATNGGVASGGFIFEWNDEFWKATAGGGACATFQCGGTNGNPLAPGSPLNTVSTSNTLYYDSAWFGLTTGSNLPRTVRQSYCWFQLRWTGSYASPCPV